ncbi:MAG TPA: YbbR-like domain-containing protein, partial [Xylanibacter oryzae]|nr:YbbR-like domain-containing protein [Xylanibacter oryzae]
MALNETYEKEIKIPVRIVNVPKNVVVSDAVDTMRVTVRDKGWFIAALIYGNRVRPVYIDFLTYSKNNNGECSVSTSDLIKQVVQMLSGSARVTAAKPDKIEFFFSYGESKRVPVKFIGKVTPDETYYLARMLIQPDSITVFASPEILDKIHYVSTEELRYSHFADTITVNAHLQKIRGAKINQSAVKITFFTDILTEESIDVPITGENLPMGKVLRTFPSHVTVSFITGVANYRRLRPDNFSVVV